MKPRAMARRHLPELDQSFDLLAETFNAKLVHLDTPDGSAGKKPDWLDLMVKPSPRWTPPRTRRGR